MPSIRLLYAARVGLTCLILPLSVAVLIAEILPEVEAKVIVIPTLICIISLCVLEIHQRFFTKR